MQVQVSYTFIARPIVRS